MLVFVASLFIQIFSLAQPLIIQQIIDKVIGQQNFNTLYFLGVLLIGCSVISNILNLIRTFLFTDTTNRIDIATSGNILTHLFKLPLNYFDRRPVGEISTRPLRARQHPWLLNGNSSNAYSRCDFRYDLFFRLDILQRFAYRSFPVRYSSIPCYGLYCCSSHQTSAPDHAEANAAASALMVESLTGIQTVKAQHAETTLRWRWQQRYARFISSNFRTALIGATSGSIGSFFTEIGGLAVLWVGAYLVLEGQLTVGQLIAFRIISGNVVGPIIRLAGTWQTIQSLQISIERLADVVDAPTEQAADVQTISLPRLRQSRIRKC